MLWVQKECIGTFEQGEIDKIMEESLKMKHFDHQNILSLIGVCIEARPAPYIVMPYMPNGSLLEFLRKERVNLLLKDSTDMEDYIVSKIEYLVCEYVQLECMSHIDPTSILDWAHNIIMLQPLLLSC